MDDPVERQVAAYNAYDLDGFLACFAEDVVVTGPDGAVQLRGLQEMRVRYGALFAGGDIQAEIVGRLRAGDWVVDHERVSRPGMSLEVLVAYQVSDGRITQMVTLR